MADNTPNSWSWGWVSSTVNSVVTSASTLGKNLLETEGEEIANDSAAPEATQAEGSSTAPTATAGDAPPSASETKTEEAEESASSTAAPLSSARMFSFLNSLIADVKNANELQFVKNMASDIAQSTAVATKKLYNEGHVYIEKGVDALEVVGKTATKYIDLDSWNRPISVSTKVGGASGAAFEELFREYNGLTNMQILKSFAKECAHSNDVLMAAAIDQGQISPEQVKELKAIVDALEQCLQQDQFILENAKSENYSDMLLREHAVKIVVLSTEGHAKAKHMLTSFAEVSDRPASSGELLSTTNVVIEKAKIEALLLYAKLASLAIEELLKVARFMASKAESHNGDEGEEDAAKETEKEPEPLRLLPASWRSRIVPAAVETETEPSTSSTTPTDESAAAAGAAEAVDQQEKVVEAAEEVSTADDTYLEVAGQLKLYVFLVMKEMFALSNAFTEAIQQTVALAKSRVISGEEEDAIKGLHQELNHKAQASCSELSMLSNVAFSHVLDSLASNAIVLKSVAVTIG